ncbi:MAG: DUF547 domain-containing protein [Pseudomonadota bacterium]
MNNRQFLVPWFQRLLLAAAAISAAACVQENGWNSEHWPADDNSIVTIDHNLWQQTLNDYLLPAYNDVNRVDYAGLKHDGMTTLNKYLAEMSSVDLASVRRDEQMAFWINVYNAMTFKVIAEAWPVESILTLDNGKGPWDRPVFENNQRVLSLNDIEHRLLRGLWNEPRIHFAVNCASIGCPDVQPIAFTGQNLESLLTLAAQNFLRHPRAVRREGTTLHLSSLFDWYADDFGNNKTAVRDSLANMGDTATATRLTMPADEIAYAYDWGINGPESEPH